MTTPILDISLSPLQHHVIALLASGLTVTATAQAAHIHRSTISYWGRTNPDFSAALREAKQDRAEHWHSFADQQAERAFTALGQLIDNEKTPPATRFKAIALIVNEVLKTPAPPSDEQLSAERIVRHAKACDRLVAAEYGNDEAALQRATEDEEAAGAQLLAHEPTHPHILGQCRCLPCLVQSEQEDLIRLRDEAAAAAAELDEELAPELEPEPTDSSDFVTSRHSATPDQTPQPTSRRSTPHIGPNDKCPCGSRRKYKKCCRDKQPVTPSGTSPSNPSAPDSLTVV